ncbi:hypothetical protein D3C71_1270900 [compost metagenome]
MPSRKKRPIPKHSEGPLLSLQPESGRLITGRPARPGQTFDEQDERGDSVHDPADNRNESDNRGDDAEDVAGNPTALIVQNGDGNGMQQKGDSERNPGIGDHKGAADDRESQKGLVSKSPPFKQFPQ